MKWISLILLVCAMSAAADEVYTGNWVRDPYPLLTMDGHTKLAFRVSAYRYDPGARITSPSTATKALPAWSGSPEAALHSYLSQSESANDVVVLARYEWTTNVVLALFDTLAPNDPVEHVCLRRGAGGWTIATNIPMADVFTQAVSGHPFVLQPGAMSYTAADVAGMASYDCGRGAPGESLIIYAAITNNALRSAYTLSAADPRWSRLRVATTNTNPEAFVGLYSPTLWPDAVQQLLSDPAKREAMRLAYADLSTITVIGEIVSSNRVLSLLAPGDTAYTNRTLSVLHWVKEGGQWNLAPFLFPAVRVDGEPASHTVVNNFTGSFYAPALLLGASMNALPPLLSFLSDESSATHQQEALIPVVLNKPAHSDVSCNYTIKRAADLVLLGQGHFAIKANENVAIIHVPANFWAPDGELVVELDSSAGDYLLGFPQVHRVHRATAPATVSQVNFVHAAGDQYADDGAGSVPVELTQLRALDATVEFNVAFTADRATGIYTTTTNTLTIPAGTRIGAIPFVVPENVLNGNDAAAVFRLRRSLTPGVSVGEGEIFALRLRNGPRPVAVMFETSSIVAPESAGVIEIPLKLSKALPTDLTVSVNVTPGDATDGVDYAAPVTTAVIPAGQTGATLSIQVAEDDVEEANETLTVSLASVGSAVPGTIDTCTVTLVDVK